MARLLLLILSLTLTSNLLANHDTKDWINSELLEVDLNQLPFDEEKSLLWANTPIRVIKLSTTLAKQIDEIPSESLENDSEAESLLKSLKDAYTFGFEKTFFIGKNLYKRNKEKVLVFSAVSPYQGCVIRVVENPKNFKIPQEIKYLYYDPCSGRYFDFRGRGFKQESRHETYNLTLVPYQVKGSKLLIGNQDKMLNEALKKQIHKLDNDYSEIKNDNDFYHAIGNNRVISIKKYLLNNKIDLNKPIHRGVRPLLYAILFDHKDLIKLFLEHGANFRHETPNQHLAGCLISYKDTKEQEYLYQLGLDPNERYCKNYDGCFVPPLIDIIEGYPRTQVFIESLSLAQKYGFDISKKHCGKSLLDHIKENNRKDILDELKPLIPLN